MFVCTLWCLGTKLKLCKASEFMLMLTTEEFAVIFAEYKK